LDNPAVADRLTPGVGADELIAAADTSRLGTLVRRGAAWSFSLFVARHIISVGATAILSRILSPGDYGLLGMVATLTALLQIFSDMGLSWATVSSKSLTRGQVDNLFWVNVFVGAALWGLAALAGPLLAWFYGYEQLAVITALVGSNFLLAGIGVQPMALLKRQMKLRQWSLGELLALTVGTVTGLTMAIAGCGYWALVGQSIAGQLVLMIVLLVISGYRPGLPQRGRGTMALLKFGGWLAAAGIPIFLSRNLDCILIGKVWGPIELGYYSRAYYLMMFPSLLATSVTTAVMVPALSSLQHDKERLGRVYRKAVSVIALVSFPAAVGLAVAAPEAVRLLYGTKWLPVIPILTWLSIASILQPVYNTNGWLYVACGKGKAFFLWYSFAGLVLAVAFFVSVPWGSVGVALAYALAMLCGLAIGSLYFAHRAAGLSVRRTLRPLASILAASILMGAAAWSAGRVVELIGAQWPWILAAKVCTGILVYLVLALILECVPIEVSPRCKRQNVTLSV